MNPFITIDWMGSVEKTLGASDRYPNCSRFRIRSDSVMTHTDSKQLQYELMRVKEATEVVFKSESTFDASKIKTVSGTFNKENLRDGKTHKKLIREYYSDGKLDDDYFEKFDNLIEKYLSQVTRGRRCIKKYTMGN